jgi:hypothetical protein
MMNWYIRNAIIDLQSYERQRRLYQFISNTQWSKSNALFMDNLFSVNVVSARLLCAGCGLSWRLVCLCSRTWVFECCTFLYYRCFVSNDVNSSALVSLIFAVFCYHSSGKLNCWRKRIVVPPAALWVGLAISTKWSNLRVTLLFLVSIALLLSTPPYLFVVTQHLVKTPRVSPNIL